jgi:hypothetical protein
LQRYRHSSLVEGYDLGQIKRRTLSAASVSGRQRRATTQQDCRAVAGVNVFIVALFTEMSGFSSVSVISNALRLRSARL